MKRTLLILFAFAACIVSVYAEDNTLTGDEKAAGWRLLFDGKTLKGWRNFHGKTPGAEWAVVKGALSLQREAKPGDPGKLMGGLITEEEFNSFELSIDWRISPGANSGIFYRVSEAGKQPNETGIEYQVLDNQQHPDAKRGPERQAGACYALYRPAKDVTRPVGEWNRARIIVRGRHVEHWLNDTKLLEYELGSEDWERHVANSKFKAIPTYGRSPKGHILLQDHGHHAEFRNIKLRPLTQ